MSTPARHTPCPLEMRMLWEIRLSFEATQEEADGLLDDAVAAICNGTGEGADHRCGRDIAGVLKPYEEDEDDD